MVEIQIGDRVKLVDANGLSLNEGDEGVASSVVNVEGDSYVGFFPDNNRMIYYISANRLEVIIDNNSPD